MNDYTKIIQTKYPNAVFGQNFEIAWGPDPTLMQHGTFDEEGNFIPPDNSNVPIVAMITLWTLPDPQPTIAELDAYAASPEYAAAVLAQAKAAVVETINNQATEVRARYRTPHMAETYAQKQRDVDTWKRGGKQVTDIPYAARRAARRNGIPGDELDRLTHAQLQEAIDEYEAAIAALRVVDLDIEDIREQAKEAITAAATVEEVEAIVVGLSWPIVPE